VVAAEVAVAVEVAVAAVAAAAAAQQWRKWRRQLRQQQGQRQQLQHGQGQRHESGRKEEEPGLRDVCFGEVLELSVIILVILDK
jgi:membrane protein implicated in regulation of membrane protease activity